MKQGKHDWICISPGMYDDTYECKNCGKKHTISIDVADHGLPEFGCVITEFVYVCNENKCANTLCPQHYDHRPKLKPLLDPHDDTSRMLPYRTKDFNKEDHCFVKNRIPDDIE